MVRGVLSGWCQRTLFGDVEVSSPEFRAEPEIQTFSCPVCRQSYSLNEADVEYDSGPLIEGLASREGIYSRPGEEQAHSAEELLVAARRQRGNGT